MLEGEKKGDAIVAIMGVWRRSRHLRTCELDYVLLGNWLEKENIALLVIA